MKNASLRLTNPLPMVVAGVFMLSLAVLLFIPQQVAAKVETPKIDICHAESSDVNPYNSLSVDKNATAGGHDDHDGGIYPANPWGDIIPSYQYSYQAWEVIGSHQGCPTDSALYTSWDSSKPCKKKISGHWKYTDYINIDDYGWVTHEDQYPGKNWTTEGQEIYNNGCVIPPVYSVESYESDYSTVKNDFYQGEIVYGKGWTEFVGNKDLRLEFKNPNGDSVEICGERKGTWSQCPHNLSNDALTGTWTIELQQKGDKYWSWSD
ncbi:MAG: hypothetical protein PHF98_00930 [Patescibacteria group bacterium]|nr:hypothetical protein [Patescibacteria group bacterium]